MATPGKIKDPRLPPPAPRSFSQKATSDQLVSVTIAQFINAKVSRQHRDILIEIGKFLVATDVDDLGLIANSTYVQSELQSVIDKLDAIAANQRAILKLFRDLVALSTTKILEIETNQAPGG